MSKPVGSAFEWQNFNEQLARLKLDDIPNEKQESDAEEERLVQSAPSAHQRLLQTLDLHVRRADEEAQRMYEVYREVRELQGDPVSPEFLRAVFTDKIGAALQARTNGVNGQCALTAQRTGGSSEGWFAPCLKKFRHDMKRLFDRWSRKLEADAQTVEYSLAVRTNDRKQSQAILNRLTEPIETTDPPVHVPLSWSLHNREGRGRVTMADGDAPPKELPTEFTDAIGALKQLFAKSLWRAKANSSDGAWSRLSGAKSAKIKFQIVDEQFCKWREDSVTAIEEWLPKYNELAKAYPELIEEDPLDWIKRGVWDLLESMCGAQRLSDMSLKPVSRNIVWWFAVATRNNPKVNLDQPEKPWVAPRWLARNRKESDWLLRKRSSDLSMRFHSVIHEELLKASVKRGIERPRMVLPASDVPLAARATVQSSLPDVFSILERIDRERERDRELEHARKLAEIKQPETSAVAPVSPLLRRYRSEIKRAILFQLTQKPSATDLEVCRALDADGGIELPENWKRKPEDRLFAQAYSDSRKRNLIESMISKVRADLSKQGLL